MATLPADGSPKDWLPRLLRTQNAIDAEHADAATVFLIKKLFKPTNAKLLRLVEPMGRQWTESGQDMIGKLAGHIVSLGGGDVAELARELCADLLDALLPTAVKMESPVRTNTGAVKTETTAVKTETATGVKSEAGDQSAPAGAPPPLPADPIKAKQSSIEIERANEHLTRIERAELLGAAYAERTAGMGWIVKAVPTAHGIGRDYKKGRAPRGEGEQRSKNGLFSLDPEEMEAAGLASSEGGDLHTLSPEEAEAAGLTPASWKPSEYGGEELVALLTELRMDLAFTCPCKPLKEIKIGSLAMHRKGQTCKRKLAAMQGLDDGMRQAAADMTHPAVLAAHARAGATPVLNTPALSVIKAAFEGAAASVPKAALKAKSPATAHVARSFSAVARSMTSGAAKRKAATKKAEKRAVALEMLLAERRAKEAAEAEVRAEAEAIERYRAKRQCRRAAAQAFLVELEARRKAQQRATRRALRSLKRMAEACMRRREEDENGIWCLGATTAEERSAAGFAQAMDLDTEPPASGPSASEPSELADSDSESDAVGGGEAGPAQDIDIYPSDLSQSSTLE